jgi:hypothetical protein
MTRISANKKFFFLLLGISLTGLSGCKAGGANVVITPRNVTIARDQQQFTFTAEVNNTQNTAVIWSIDNDNGSLGSIDPNGNYTPPKVIPTPNTLTISATSVGDPGANDAVSVTLVSGDVLQFGTNTQVTNYTSPLAPGLLVPGCIPTTSCIAATSSSGQHSVKVFRNTSGPYINIFIYTVWSDNRNGVSTYDVFFRQITIRSDTSQNPSIQTTSLSNIVKINSISSADPADPSIAVDNSGFVYVAWSGRAATNRVVYINKSTSNPNTAPSQQVTFTPGFDVRFSDFTNCDQRAPSIATDGANVYVAWQDNRIPNTSSSCGISNIRVARGVPPSPPPAPSPSPGNFIPPESFPLPFSNTTTAEDQTEPSVGLFGGNLYVAWTNAQTVNHDIYFTKGPVNANITLTVPVRVNDDVGGADHTTPSLALDSLGNVYVAWLDTRNDPSPTTCPPLCKNDIFFAKSINAGLSFDAVPTPTITFPTTTIETNITEHNTQVNDDTDSANHAHPSIAVENPEPNAAFNTPDKIYVAWQDNRNHPGSSISDIFTAKSVDGGNTFRPNSAPANTPPGNESTYNSNISVDIFGRAYLIWTDERNNAGMPGAASDVFYAIGQ